MSGSDLCIPRNETALPRYFQNRIIMFCLPISTFMHLWAIYMFPGSVCLFCCSQRGRLMLGIYINSSQIHECRNWVWGPTVSFLGIHKSDFRYSASLSLFFSIGERKNPACIYLIVQQILQWRHKVRAFLILIILPVCRWLQLAQLAKGKKSRP